MTAVRPPESSSPISDKDLSPFGSILDVAGIGVGHHQRTGRGWQTGTTVVSCAGGATPGADVRGGGPGTRETDALRPENLVDEIHAVCLTGGSAYGLAAADGVMAELESRGLGVPVAEGLVVPVVPTAVIFDLARGGDGNNRPGPDFGRRAAAASLRTRSTPRWGSVGAGTGARSGGLQGGVGTASVITRVELLDDQSFSFTVGALAVVNSHGSAIDPQSGLPWQRTARGWARPDRQARQRLSTARTTVTGGSLNTTIGVVATDARLDKASATKVATVAHDGLARAVRPAHALVDGDTVFTLATGAVDWPPEARVGVMNAVTAAAADVFALACTHAVVSARTIGAAPAWFDCIG